MNTMLDADATMGEPVRGEVLVKIRYVYAALPTTERGAQDCLLQMISEWHPSGNMQTEDIRIVAGLVDERGATQVRVDQVLDRSGQVGVRNQKGR
jgi:hypothetical protein